MKKVLQGVFQGIGITCCFYITLFLVVFIGYTLGAEAQRKEEAKSNSISMTRPIEEIEDEYKNEMIITNALLNGLHWCMINDSSLWKSTFVTTLEYKNIEALVEWDDFCDSDWRAKEVPEDEDLNYFHK